MTEEQVLSEFQQERPEMFASVTYLMSLHPGQEPVPLLPIRAARELANWMLDKGYISTRQTQRLQLGLDTMEHEAPTGAGKVIRVLNMLQILLHGAR